jgi:hypothetical protein
MTTEITTYIAPKRNTAPSIAEPDSKIAILYLVAKLIQSIY